MKIKHNKKIILVFYSSFQLKIVFYSSTTKSAIAPGEIEVTKDKDFDVSKVNRNTKNTLNKIEPIFDMNKIRTQQELSALFGQVGFRLAGDIIAKNNIKEGSIEAMAIHGAIGGSMAKLGGGDFAKGASIAAINNLTIATLGKLKDKNGKPLFTPAQLRGISSTMGALIAKGLGSNTDQGAAIADSATRNNWLTHEQQQKMAQELKNAQTEEEKAEIYKRYSELSKENIEKYGVRDEIMEKDLLDIIKDMGHHNMDENKGINYNLDKLAKDYNNEMLPFTLATVGTLTDSILVSTHLPEITKVEWVSNPLVRSIVNTLPANTRVIVSTGKVGVGGGIMAGIDIARDCYIYSGNKLVKAVGVDLTKAYVTIGVAGALEDRGMSKGQAIIFSGVFMIFADITTFNYIKNNFIGK